MKTFLFIWLGCNAGIFALALAANWYGDFKRKRRERALAEFVAPAITAEWWAEFLEGFYEKDKENDVH